MSGYGSNILRNNLLGTIDSWGPLFRVSLNLRIHSIPDSPGPSSVLAFKANGGESNAKQYGDRVPIIFCHPNDGLLSFQNSVNGNFHYGYKWKTKTEMDKWYHIEIKQYLYEGEVRNVRAYEREFSEYCEVHYRITIDGVEIHRTVNSDARVFTNVKVFASDPFHSPTNATYKNLVWENLGKTSPTVN